MGEHWINSWITEEPDPTDRGKIHFTLQIKTVMAGDSAPRYDMIRKTTSKLISEELMDEMSEDRVPGEEPQGRGDGVSEEQLYHRIAEKIDSGPLGAPKAGDSFSRAFIDYLKLLYNPEEANLVQHLEMPMKFKQAAEVAEATGRDEEEVKEVLDTEEAHKIIDACDNLTLVPCPCRGSES